jgi:deazaflavin-dependent oxidoreductase (nitroreductase family)
MAQREMPQGMKLVMSSPLMKAMQRANTWLYRASGGKLGASMRGAPVLLLTTRGRKSGEPRTVPLLYLRDGDDVVIVASKGGWPEHPLWYLNLQAHPEVQIEIGGDKLARVARTANPEERARLWPQLIALYADYASYQSWSDREIPVVILSPAG